MNDTRRIAGIDMGSGKISVVIGELSDRRDLRIVGAAHNTSKGIREGHIVSPERTVAAIIEAVNTASEMAGFDVKSAMVGITGRHLMGQTSKGFVPINRDSLEVTEADVVQSLDQAKAVSVPMGREIIYVHPNSFVLDDQKGIRDPVGMIGTRLEVEAYIVTAQSTVLRNMERSFERADVDPIRFIFQPLAASYAVLEDEDMMQGAAVVDIGKGTTDLAIWYDGNLVHTSVLAIGGEHVTNDLAIGLKTSKAYAEELKLKYGAASTRLVPESELVKVESIQGNKEFLGERKLIAAIIEPRIEEMLKFVQQEILRSGYADRLLGGIFLVGGTSQLAGIRETAEEVFNMPVSVGRARNVFGSIDWIRNPAFVSCVGLLKIWQRSRDNLILNHQGSAKGIKSILRQVGRFFKENF
jgi:cell division protein FtsA